MRKHLTIAALSLAFLAFGAPAQASLITSSSGLGPSTSVVDFSQFDTGQYTFTNGPTQVGGAAGQDIVFSASYSRAGFGGRSYGLLSNGRWSDPAGAGKGRDGYAFTNARNGSMTFTFNSGLVSGVGGFINYCASCRRSGPALIEALDMNGLVLEAYNLEMLAPISTPGQTNGGAFRGIARAQADIGGFRLSNKYIVVDDLEFAAVKSISSVSQVSEPVTLALVGFGLVGMGFAARRRKRL